MFQRARASRTALIAAAALIGVFTGPSLAATVASDQPAGLIVFPKLQVDTAGVFLGANTDTVVQITNTSTTDTRNVHCFYVNATRHCELSGGVCNRSSQCVAVGGSGDFCADPPWTANNFTFALSPNQTIGWNVSVGRVVPFPGSGAILPVVEDPFIGELKCLEVSDSTPGALPLNANDLIGTATIVRSASAGTVIDANAHNAIGIQSVVADETSQNDLVLCLGGTPGSAECAAPGEYAACPRSLWMNHFFDGAQGPGAPVRSNTLTLVPCSENFEEPTEQLATTVQFLIYNEFEQRFSARTTVECYADLPLVFIDSRVSGQNSVFSLAIQGTLAGQTLIRPILGNETTAGHGLLGVGEQSLATPGALLPATSSFNLNYTGANPQGDIVRFIIP